MELILGDCLEKLKELEDNSIDSIVTDPPYGISFMGKKWDYDVPQVEVWKECLRVLKPGGYLLSFAGTRTQHRMAVNIEDAGFEIRDMIAWVYGSGFPKSLNIGKAVDKLQGNERKISGYEERFGREGRKAKCGFKEEYVGASGTQDQSAMKPIMLPVSEEAKQWEGWGTALKPALEPITVARKPIEGTVAENCLKWGVGGINIDGSRVGTEEMTTNGKGKQDGNTPIVPQSPDYIGGTHIGRFPANLIHDGSDEVVGLFPQTKSAKAGFRKSANGSVYRGNSLLTSKTENQGTMYYGDSGSAARFFYCAKASKRERNIGCEGLETSQKFTAGNYSQSPTCKDCNLTLNGTNDHSKCSGEVYYKEMENKNTKNNHPTVKPVALMRYLCRLITPKGGVILDPYMGSGTTGIGAKLEGFDFIGIEREEEYIKIAQARIEAWEVDEQLELSKLLTK